MAQTSPTLSLFTDEARTLPYFLGSEKEGTRDMTSTPEFSENTAAVDPTTVDPQAVQEASANASQIEQAIADGDNPKHKGESRAESAAGQVEFEVGG